MYFVTNEIRSNVVLADMYPRMEKIKQSEGLIKDWCKDCKGLIFRKKPNSLLTSWNAFLIYFVRQLCIKIFMFVFHVENSLGSWFSNLASLRICPQKVLSSKQWLCIHASKQSMTSPIAKVLVFIIHGNSLKVNNLTI